MRVKTQFMAELPISQELADNLIRFAQQHNSSLEDILKTVVDADQAGITPTYSRLEDDPAYKAAEKRILPKLYARARAYWKSIGHTQRLALNDAELDEQSWCIDPVGIPRLKSDKSNVVLPPDPLVATADRQWERWQKNNQGSPK